MKLEQGIFSAEFEIFNSTSFGVCFKDSAENWDNNSGDNYVFSISKRPTKRAKESKIAKVETSKVKTSKTKASKAKASKAKIST
jgi:hypothetical protein